MTNQFSAFISLLALGLVAGPVSAQQQFNGPVDQPEMIFPSATPLRSIEFDAGGEHLSNGYGNWHNETLLGTYQIDQHVLQAELTADREFGEDGTFAGIADTYTINPDWFTRLSVGAGDGAFYLPRVRGDASISKKWLAERNLVTSIGLGYYEAPDGHIDRNINIGGTYYFSTPWIVEAGVRYNNSDPGSISTHQQFFALTYGREKTDVMTFRYGWGGEGYQEIGGGVSLVDFQSHEASLAWRHWLSNNLGLMLRLDDYHNPYYRREGANLGIFYQF